MPTLKLTDQVGFSVDAEINADSTIAGRAVDEVARKP